MSDNDWPRRRLVPVFQGAYDTQALVSDLKIYAAAADGGERISKSYATGRLEHDHQSVMGDCLRSAAARLEALDSLRLEALEALEPFAEIGATCDEDWYTTNRAVAELELEQWRALAALHAKLKGE